MFWVDLATVTDPGAVPFAVMGALGLDAKGLDPLGRITGYLGDRQVLVVLDNCEHVVAAIAELVDQLLPACPNVVGLATSREPLNVGGENCWRVQPLALPDPALLPGAPLAGPAAQGRPTEALLAAEAVQLFLDRATSARADFRWDDRSLPVIAEICTRLDGIPLAIELAAARVRALSPERLLASLADRFRVLTGGSRSAQPRQQTLAASVQWSHDLLAEPERVLLRRLSVLNGIFDLDAAEGVAQGGSLEGWEVLTLLPDLVDKSLVVFDGERYRLLQTIREFAAAHLAAAAEVDATRAAHLAHYAGVATAAAAELERAPQLATLERLEAARDNIEAAIDWALTSGTHDAALKIAGDLALFWQLHGRHSESMAILRRVLDHTPADASPLRARALWAAGQLGLFGMDLPGMFGTLDTARAIEMARTAACEDVLGRALGMHGFVLMFMAPESAGDALAEAHALAVEAGDPYGRAAATTYAAMTFVFALDRPNLAAPHLALLEGEVAATGSPFWASWLGLIKGIAAWRAGHLDQAAHLLGEADELAWAVGEPVLESWCARWLADVHTENGDYAAAERVVARSSGWMDRSSYARLEIVLSRGIQPSLLSGDLGQARRRLVAVDSAMACAPFLQAEAGLLGGRLALAEGDLGEARTRAEAAAAAAEVLQTPGTSPTPPTWPAAWPPPAGTPAAPRTRTTARSPPAWPAVSSASPPRLSTASRRRPWRGRATRRGRASTALPVPCGTGPGTRARRWRSRRSTPTWPGYVRRWATRRSPVRSARERPSRSRRPPRTPRGPGASASGPLGWDSLTATERQVVDLAAEGLSNVDIARRLFVSPGTVKVHLHHIFGKLGVIRRAELAARATERRLGSAPGSS